MSGTTHSIILSPSASRLHPPTQTRLQTTNINDERQMDAAPELATVISLTHVQTQFIPTVLPSMTVDVLPTDSSPMVFSSMTVDMSPTDGSPMVFLSMTADVSPTDDSPMVFPSMTVDVLPTDGSPMVFPSMTVDVSPTDGSPMVFLSMTVDVSPTDGGPMVFPSMTVDVSPTDGSPMVFSSMTVNVSPTDGGPMVFPSMTVDVSPTDGSPMVFSSMTVNVSPTDGSPMVFSSMTVDVSPTDSGPMVFSSMTADVLPTDDSPMVFSSMTVDVSPTDSGLMVFSSMTVNVSPTDGGPMVFPSMTVDVSPTDGSPMVFSSMTVNVSPTDGSPMVFSSMTVDVSPTDSGPMVFSSMTADVLPTDDSPMVFSSMTVDVSPTDSGLMVFPSMTVDVSPTDSGLMVFPSMTVDVSPTDSGPMVFPSVTMETLVTDSVFPSMTVDVSPTDVGPILFTPNISPTDRGRAGSRRLLLILGGAILGPLVLVVFMVIAVTIACFVCRRKKTHSQTIDRSSDRVQNIESPKPLYAEVFEPVAPEQTADSLVPVSHEGNSQVPEPHEILAYDTDIPETFRPFAPPPPVTGVKNGTNHQSRANVANTYDIPRAVYNDSDTPDWRYHNRGSAIRLLGNNDPYYDQVETVHNDLRASTSLTSSLQLLIPSTQSYQDNVHTLPAHFRSAHRSKRRESPDYDHVYNEALEPSMLQNSVSSDGSEWGLPFAPIYDVPKPLKKSEELLQISRQKIVEIRNLGVGRFGKVVLAATVGVSLKDLKLGTNDDRNRSILVAIKKLREDADSHLKDMFEQEIKFMTRLKNANVVRLLGVCKGAESFLMMEYMENGDLHEFLQKQKLVSDSLPGLQKGEITPLIQLYMAVQIASGMRYLASMKFVHRDLAARNCLVGRDFVVKISDFGMSRKLYDSVYYRIRGHLILPIRWMANESFYGKFSVKSDVWSFGITVWEIFTLAQNEPYHEMTDEELIADAIKEEGRKLLPNPSTCPKDIYDILLRCWVHEPLIRADFEEVYSRLFTVYTKLSKQAKRHTSISMQ